MSVSEQNFFSVASSFKVLVNKIAPEQLWLEPELLIAQMPTAFKLMAQVADLEQDCFPLLQKMENSVAGLTDYLKLQSRKIDLVLQQHLAQDQNADMRGIGEHFGGSGVTIAVPEQLEIGQAVALRVFIHQEFVALYAHGEVKSVEASEQGFSTNISFTSITEHSQEQLVRASLQVQQKQLRELAQKRNAG